MENEEVKSEETTEETEVAVEAEAAPETVEEALEGSDTKPEEVEVVPETPTEEVAQ